MTSKLVELNRKPSDTWDYYKSRCPLPILYWISVSFLPVIYETISANDNLLEQITWIIILYISDILWKTKENRATVLKSMILVSPFLEITPPVIFSFNNLTSFVRWAPSLIPPVLQYILFKWGQRKHLWRINIITGKALTAIFLKIYALITISLCQCINFS